MSPIVCKECGYSLEKKEPGIYYCPNCEREKKFLRFDAFCGSKPGELHEQNNEQK